MRKLDQRGVAALEFCLVALPLFLLMMAIFDLGRYAITFQSLRALANVGARVMMVNCYTPTVIGTTPVSPWSSANTSPSSCTGDPLPADADKQAIAPLLYNTGGPPTLTIPAPAAGATALTVTASQPNFTMIMPVWGTAFNAPSASTSVPF